MLGCLLCVAILHRFDRGDRTRAIAIKDFQFQPVIDTLRVGDTIAWKNHDIVPHTATSDAPGFDSKTIPAKASWRYVAKTRGRLAYHCALHPTMKGVLVIR